MVMKSNKDENAGITNGGSTVITNTTLGGYSFPFTIIQSTSALTPDTVRLMGDFLAPHPVH